MRCASKGQECLSYLKALLTVWLYRLVYECLVKNSLAIQVAKSADALSLCGL